MSSWNEILPYLETQPKEEPMTEKTIPFTELGNAKKQRDVLRNRFKSDVSKFAQKFGCSNFEAAHAIMDTLLNQYNDYAKCYDGCAMPNALAQTLLPDTQALIDGGGKIATPVDPFWSPVPQKLSKGKLINSKPKSHGLAKLDKDVTESDLSGTYLVEYSKNPVVLDKTLKELKAAYEDNLYLRGSKYVYNGTDDAMHFGLTGSMKVIWKMSKAAPYINVKDVSAYKLYAPQGYKFRKLKNKPIYKVIKDLKQVSYWKKVEEKLDTISPYAEIPEGAPTVLSLTSTSGYPSSVMVGEDYGGGVAKTFPNVPKGYAWIKTSSSKDLVALVKVETEPISTATYPGTIKAYDKYGSCNHIIPESVVEKWVAEGYPILVPGYVWVPTVEGSEYQAKKVKEFMKVPQDWAKEHSPASLGMSGMYWETYVSKPTQAILMPSNAFGPHTGQDGQKYTSAKAEFPFNPKAWGGDLF